MRSLLLLLLLSVAACERQPAAPETTPAAAPAQQVHLGPRPFYLLDDMTPGPLKDRLAACTEQPMAPHPWSIGHRGAPLQFPEHTEESYRAAARMGAGILECDVAFTRDRELVCRHAQCDLHTTTNILATPLAAQCSVPPTPLGNGGYDFSQVRCCTSDISLAQFKSLRGKMDAANPRARTLDEYMNATLGWRTDLYAQQGTLLSHRESIALFQSLGVKMTPELKAPEVPMPFAGPAREGDDTRYTQEDYARQLIEEYIAAGVPPEQVYVQSFQLEDVRFWIREYPAFGRQAVWLDGRYSRGLHPQDAESWRPDMASLKAEGINIIAPPIWMLLIVDEQQRIVPSRYARAAREAGLDIIAWSLERDGPLAGGGGFYHQSIRSAITRDGDTFRVLDVLAQDIGVLGVFSDWPATTTYYANCQL